jgi:hypothetical protein
MACGRLHAVDARRDSDAGTAPLFRAFSLPFSGMGWAVLGANKSGAVSAFFFGFAS